MPQAISNQFKLDLAKLEQNTLIELFEVDLRSLRDDNGISGELYRFYAGYNEQLQPIVWQGKTYQPIGVKADGFELSGNGPSNRPTLTIGNVDGIVIEDYVWIGIGAILLKGIRIGSGAVIAAGSVVTKNVPSNCMVAGNPAHIIRKDIHWR